MCVNFTVTLIIFTLSSDGPFDNNNSIINPQKISKTDQVTSDLSSRKLEISILEKDLRKQQIELKSRESKMKKLQEELKEQNAKVKELSDDYEVKDLKITELEK